MVTAGNQAQRYDKKMTYARDETKKNADETDRRKKMRMRRIDGKNAGPHSHGLAKDERSGHERMESGHERMKSGQ